MEKTNRVEKLAVRYGQIEKSVRTTGEKYCGQCKCFKTHINLKPSAFDTAFSSTKTTEVCLGCHQLGRYRGQVVDQFILSSEHHASMEASA